MQHWRFTITIGEFGPIRFTKFLKNKYQMRITTSQHGIFLVWWGNMVFQHTAAAVPLPLSLPLSGAQRLLMPILVCCQCCKPSLINSLPDADWWIVWLPECWCCWNTHGLMESRQRIIVTPQLLLLRLVELTSLASFSKIDQPISASVFRYGLVKWGGNNSITNNNVFDFDLQQCIWFWFGSPVSTTFDMTREGSTTS